ncbi:hypothetical protein HOY80DRAFT_955540 [Tuber brumale]|nr:hypothetical protein HOY80DRAFT_955540 [Tuber brumale]
MRTNAHATVCRASHCSILLFYFFSLFLLDRLNACFSFCTFFFFFSSFCFLPRRSGTPPCRRRASRV